MELSEETPKLVSVSVGFVPFSDTTVGVSVQPPRSSTAFTVALGDVAAKREEALDVSAAKGLDVPDWTGGRGARYLTLVDCGLNCVTGEDGFVASDPDGTGGAGDLIDLGLAVRGFR